MRKYRIKKTTYKSGDTTYRVQRTFMHFFWINTSKIHHLRLDYRYIGTPHDSITEAKKEIRQQIKWDLDREKVSGDIITWE